MIKGIQLPAFDVEMLILGKLIAVPFLHTLRQGEEIWLYPSQQIPCNLNLKQYYQPEYLTQAMISFNKYQKCPISIKAWAICELHWQIHSEQKHLLPTIAQSTIWKLSALENIFQQHQVLKLLILRVHQIYNFWQVSTSVQPGAFFWYQSENLITTKIDNTLVVSNASFNKRKDSLFKGNIYPHQAIESLQLQFEQIPQTLHAQKLNHDIKQFLGWTTQPPMEEINKNMNWIQNIVAYGNRSIEHEEKKSNYQAGTDFENIVRQSLEFLGFQVDSSHKGGAGGLDLFCSKPYPLVCECKSGKSIPNRTVEELIKLGGRHLGAEAFLNSVKLVIGSGKPSSHTLEAAVKWKISIINSMTLQNLVEFHSKHPGAINLMDLKNYLEPGQIDYRIDEYIAKTKEQINLRSHIVKVLKNYLEVTHHESIGVEALHGAYVNSNPPKSSDLSRRELHEILIELSSPLTGYLGRIKGEDWLTDRFYFLRDFPI